MINSRNIIGILAIVVGVTYLLSLLPTVVLIGLGAWALSVVLILMFLAGGTQRTPAEDLAERNQQYAWVCAQVNEGK